MDSMQCYECGTEMCVEHVRAEIVATFAGCPYCRVAELEAENGRLLERVRVLSEASESDESLIFDLQEAVVRLEAAIKGVDTTPKPEGGK